MQDKDAKETVTISKKEYLDLKEKTYMAALYLNLHRCKHCGGLVNNPYCCINNNCPEPHDP